MRPPFTVTRQYFGSGIENADQCAFFSRRFSRWRFSLASSRSSAVFGTVSTLRKAHVKAFGWRTAFGKAAAAGLPLGTSLGNTQVRLGDALLPLSYANDGQINAQVPTDVAMNTELQLSVNRGTTISLPQQVVTATAAPGVFTRDQSGTGSGLIVDGATNVPNDPDHPARAGDTIVIYCTGLGLVTPLPASGEGADGPASTDNPVTLTIGGQPAQVSYAGLTPGFPGLYQINAVVAAGTPSGNQLPAVLTVARQISLPVTMSVR